MCVHIYIVITKQPDPYIFLPKRTLYYSWGAVDWRSIGLIPIES